MSLYQGTTPTHTFVLPFETAMARDFRIVYIQNGVKKIEKKKNDEGVELGENSISFMLTQEETLNLTLDDVEIQLKIKTLEDEVVVTKKIKVTIGECLDKEVI